MWTGMPVPSAIAAIFRCADPTTISSCFTCTTLLPTGGGAAPAGRDTIIVVVVVVVVVLPVGAEASSLGSPAFTSVWVLTKIPCGASVVGCAAAETLRETEAPW